MTKKSIPDVSGQLYSLLEPFSASERLRLVQAALTLLGDVPDLGTPGQTPQQIGGSRSLDTGRDRGAAKLNERDYFKSKEPASKVEQLAVAARFRELAESAQSNTREQLRGVFAAARVNFDGGNFGRDIDNARTSGLFNKEGSAEDGYTLSAYGQELVDTLPDREAAKALSKATRKKPRKRKQK